MTSTLCLWSHCVQGLPKEYFPGLVNFVTAVAYLFCLNLPRALSQPGKHSLATPTCELHCGRRKRNAAQRRYMTIVSQDLARQLVQGAL